jgi:hypothetical protein
MKEKDDEPNQLGICIIGLMNFTDSNGTVGWITRDIWGLDGNGLL